MPELPEVETVMRALDVRLRGHRCLHVEQRRADIRFPLPERLPARLAGRRVLSFSRRAKYIQALLDDGAVLLLHLGMSGRLVFDGPAGGPHEHLTFTFDDGTVLRFVDPRRFGMVDLTTAAELSAHPWLRHLGVEPLAEAFDAATLLRLLAGKRVAVKTALMDQRLVVGVGNIYASEALWRAGISPRRTAYTLGPGRASRLVGSVKEVLAAAILAGGSSLRDYVQASGELGNFQRGFKVYDREGEPCAACARSVTRIVQGGRATFYCGRCQR